MNSQAPLRKSQTKRISAEQISNIDGSARFWKKKMPPRTLGNKKEKQGPGLKAGKDRLIPLFCANAAEFMIRITLTYKAANPKS